MLSLIYPISFLFSLTGLILWFYFKESRSLSRKMSTLFLGSFFIYLFSLAFVEATLSYKLLILFRDLLLLAAISQFFNYIRKRAMIVFIAAILVYGLVQFVGFNMLYNTFPQVTASIGVNASDEFELLVETKDGTIPTSYARLISMYGLTVQAAFEVSDPSLSRLDEFIVVGVPDESEARITDIIRELKRLNSTEYIEYNEVVSADWMQDEAKQVTVSAKHVNDPLVNDQWGWDVIQGDKLQELLASTQVKPRKKVLIAIVDSGVDAQHEDLLQQYFSNGRDGDTDPLGHGTHCAGIAAAVSNNGLGIASLFPDGRYVQVTGIKVMNSMGIGSQQATIQGMIKAADIGVDVISLSLGSLSSDSRQKAYEEAVKYANAKGAIVIAAAGNSSQNASGYSPANASGIIAVSALGTDQRKASFSNTVNDLKYGVAAPGMKIMSTYPNGQYKEMDGTSMATPMVAGLVGLLKAFRPDITTKEVYEILYETGKETSDGKATGRMIQAADAVERVID